MFKQGSRNEVEYDKKQERELVACMYALCTTYRDYDRGICDEKLLKDAVNSFVKDIDKLFVKKTLQKT